ncbi:MAG: 2-C-methyl-D-erythritol 4-phosphate cytidylyltransferase [Solirubrobacterales bacterium]
MIAAAGSGERLGAGGPKAFVELAGRPLLEWSLEACRAAGAIDTIVVAAPPVRRAGSRDSGSQW